MTAIAPDYQTPERMALKARAVPLPELRGKRVLDCGTDFGHWCWLAADKGAKAALGLDRNRVVRSHGHFDLIAHNRQKARTTGREVCKFEHIDLGKQWHEFGTFDVVLMFSMYHHFLECCGDHRPIWFWLWRHLTKDGVLLWENPTGIDDPVVQANVSIENRTRYNKADILAAAAEYFVAEYIGPALHERTREVWRFHPKTLPAQLLPATVRAGSGGATKAFTCRDGERIKEIERILGHRPVPGSLNLVASEPFDWERGYYRAQVSDVVDRCLGFGSAWAPRWARFYPVSIDGSRAWAFRFEGEKYPVEFIELIADVRLLDLIKGTQVMLCR